MSRPSPISPIRSCWSTADKSCALPLRESFEDLAFLARHDVSPPQVTTLFALLRERGLYDGTLPLTDDEGIAAGQRLLAGEGN